MTKKKKIIVAIVAALLIVAAAVGGVLIYGNSKNVKVFKAAATDWNTIDVTWKATDKDVKAAIIYSNSKFDAKAADAALKDSGSSDKISVVEGINLKDGKYKLEGLHPDTDYYITIAEKDKNGYAGALEPVVSHTKELSELGDVLKTEKVSSDSIVLTWDGFENILNKTEENDKSKDEISVKYQIKYSSLDSDKKTVSDISDTTYTVSELESLTKYTFSLTATVTIDGKTFETKPSKSVTVTTLPSTVTGISATGKNDTSIDIKWDAIKDILPDGSKLSYDLYAADKKDGEYTPIANALTDTKYTEEKLKSGTTRFYYVTVTVSLDDENKLVSDKSEIVSAQTISPKSANSTVKTTKRSSGNSGSSTATTTKRYRNQPGNATPELNAQARVIAQQIANNILADKSLTTDLAKVTKAAQAVESYARKCRYTMEGDYYASAYGVFIKGEYSCAGSARALGMVLECMGYSWTHVNENGYTHQWVELTMDGQHGWADGFAYVGQAGYGSYPFM